MTPFQELVYEASYLMTVNDLARALGVHHNDVLWWLLGKTEPLNGINGAIAKAIIEAMEEYKRGK